MPTFKKNTNPVMKRSGFKLKSGNSTTGSSFKMMGSSPMKNSGHDGEEGHKHDWGTSERYQGTLESVTPNMTDAELLALSKGMRTTEGGRMKSSKYSISVDKLKRQRNSLQPKVKETTTPVVEEKKVDPAVTLQDSRDLVLSEVIKDSPELSDARQREINEAAKLNKTKKLRKAVEKKYGMPYHEITDPTDHQMAGDAMIDEQGNILPMSAASGQHSGFKKRSGFKMSGYGKRKK